MQILKMWDKIRKMHPGYGQFNKEQAYLSGRHCLIPCGAAQSSMQSSTRYLITWCLPSNETALIYKAGHSTIKYNSLSYSPCPKANNFLHVAWQIQLASSLCVSKLHLQYIFLLQGNQNWGTGALEEQTLQLILCQLYSLNIKNY